MGHIRVWNLAAKASPEPLRCEKTSDAVPDGDRILQIVAVNDAAKTSRRTTLAGSRLTLLPAALSILAVCLRN